MRLSAARLWEIAENLHRAELTVQERAEHIAEWIRLTEQKASEVLAQLAPKPQGGRPEGGVRAAARDIGVDRDEARRAMKIAGLSEDAKAVAREVGLDDNQSALLAAAAEKGVRNVDTLSNVEGIAAAQVQQAARFVELVETPSEKGRRSSDAWRGKIPPKTAPKYPERAILPPFHQPRVGKRALERALSNLSYACAT